MRRSIVKDRAAETDLVEIWVYSYRTWGEAQAERYLSALESGVTRIASAPEAGTRRHELREGYWSKAVEHHVIFYTFTEDELRVRRVLHEVMDAPRHIETDDRLQ